jgi:hypothetical protein
MKMGDGCLLHTHLVKIVKTISSLTCSIPFFGWNSKLESVVILWPDTSLTPSLLVLD